MKPTDTPSIVPAIVALILAFALFAGCTAEPAKIPGTTPAAAAAAVTAAGTGAVTLPYGVALTVPADWTRADVMTSDDRDYGKRTTRIATFTSPAAIAGDTKSAITLNVDLDENPGGDFEVYFNQGTLAIEDSYKTQLDSHSIVKSSTLQVSGHKSYQVDFLTEDVKGYTIFTNTDKGMFIFSFRTENRQPAVSMLQNEIMSIVRSITIAP